jgi:nuclear cap-binding protein subunit 1
MKIPFVAAASLAAYNLKPELGSEMLTKAGNALQKYIDSGSWREVKLLIRFLGGLQAVFEGDGIFPLLEELFARAVDLQTTSSEDLLGLELVKIILFTIPCIMSSPATGFESQANALLEKTDIIASTPHALVDLVNTFSPEENKEAAGPSVISLLQGQLQAEASKGWELKCLPRPWKLFQDQEPDERNLYDVVAKVPFPQITVPNPVPNGARPLFPEVYISVYADQEVDTVPPTSDISCSLLREALVDTINLLDFNRIITAKYLIEMDNWYAAGTFVKRATPFDRMREMAGEVQAWKPEDVIVDAVFSQLYQLPTPEHKLVYFHSLLTECCKIAPAAIAPSLGRAIRFLYNNVDTMDLELSNRFLDWFAHHLSNFGFTWKWSEW